MKRHIFVDVNSSYICENLDVQVQKVNHAQTGMLTPCLSESLFFVVYGCEKTSPLATYA